jgi:GNAT superfamily N-acetyltransferase
LDVAGGLLAAVVTTALLLGATWGGTRYDWTSVPVLGLLATGVAALAAYLAVERRAAEPITPLRLFRNSIFTIASAQFLLATMVLFVAMLYVPLFEQTVQHRSAFTAGLFDIPLLVGLVAAIALAGPQISRTGRYKMYPVIGAVLTGVSMGVLSVADQHTGAVAIAAVMAVAGAGIGFFVQVALLAGQNAVEHGYLGVATVDVLAVVELGESSVVLRRAVAADVPAIVSLLAADQLGATRDGVTTPDDLASYQRAFRDIDRDPAHVLVVAQSGPDVVATLQLSFIPGLARRGALRAQIEAVRVADACRGGGLGAAMMAWAIAEARRRGCALVQLTSDKSRTSAHRFYERLGFVATHEGMKLAL